MSRKTGRDNEAEVRRERASCSQRRWGSLWKQAATSRHSRSLPEWGSQNTPEPTATRIASLESCACPTLSCPLLLWLSWCAPWPYTQDLLATSSLQVDSLSAAKDSSAPRHHPWLQRPELLGKGLPLQCPSQASGHCASGLALPWSPARLGATISTKPPSTQDFGAIKNMLEKWRSRGSAEVPRLLQVSGAKW